MASYYVRYNNVDLTNKIGVRTVQTTVLPPRENNSILIWERPGSIYNAYRYAEREITVMFLIRGNSAYDMETKLNDLRNIFRVDGPKPLYLGSTSQFIYAVPDGDFTMNELRYDCYECEIRFVCHDPEYYSSSVSSASNRSLARGISTSNTIDVYNNSNMLAYPIINIGINNTASFVQVENTTTGHKMLLGKYPNPTFTSTLPKRRIVLYDNMTSTSAWSTVNSSSIGSTSGSFGISNNNKGFILNRTTSASENWAGSSMARTLSSSCTDFCVKARVHFNSYGSNGDPTVSNIRYEGSVIGGSKSAIYKVMAPYVSVKDAPNGNTVGSISKGVEVTPTSSNKGWIYISHEGITGYCETALLRRYIKDRTETDMLVNAVTTTDAELRSLPDYDFTRSKLLSTIPHGTPIRIYKEPIDGFYKLYIKYNNMLGYVSCDEVEIRSFTSVCYPEDEVIISNDYCTGMCAIIGKDTSNNELFKMTVYDDNKYYEYTRPSITIGSFDNVNKANGAVLEDNNTVPKSNKSYVYNEEELNVGYDYLEEGSLGSWDNFYGELVVEKIGDKWKAWIYKIENGATVKKLVLDDTYINNLSEAQLNQIELYIGTKDGNSKCGMAITDITVEQIQSGDAYTNYAQFNAGDELQIDCCNNRIYLNNQLFNDIDMGSDFIELASGHNTIKVVSDDSNIHATVLFNERYL